MAEASENSNFISGLRFFKSTSVFISSKLVARTRGALRGTADEDENWWTRKKFAKVTVEQHWQFKTRTIGELIGRFFFFKSRTLSFNWDNTKGLLAPLHSVMLKIYPTMTSTHFSSAITRPYYYLNLLMWQMSKMYFVYLNRNYSSKKKRKKRSPWQNLKLVMKCVSNCVALTGKICKKQN